MRLFSLLVCLAIVAAAANATMVLYCWNEDMEAVETIIVKTAINREELVAGDFSVQAWEDKNWCNSCDDETGQCTFDYCIPREKHASISVIKRGGRICASALEFFDSKSEWKTKIAPKTAKSKAEAEKADL